jgi:hypothetical protein
MVIKHYFHPNPSSPYRPLKHKDLTRKTPDDEMQYADFLVERALSFLSSPPSSFPFNFPQNPKSQYQSFAIRIVSLLFRKSANLRSVFIPNRAPLLLYSHLKYKSCYCCTTDSTFSSHTPPNVVKIDSLMLLRRRPPIVFCAIIWPSERYINITTVDMGTNVLVTTIERAHSPPRRHK